MERLSNPLEVQGIRPESGGTWVTIHGGLWAAPPTDSVSRAVSGWACRCRALTSWGICLWPLTNRRFPFRRTQAGFWLPTQTEWATTYPAESHDDALKRVPGTCSACRSPLKNCRFSSRRFSSVYTCMAVLGALAAPGRPPEQFGPLSHDPLPVNYAALHCATVYYITDPAMYVRSAKW
jgi:hypothetical protein